MSDMEPLISKDAKQAGPERTTYVARTLGAGMGGGYGAAPKKDFTAVDAGFVRARDPQS